MAREFEYYRNQNHYSDAYSSQTSACKLTMYFYIINKISLHQLIQYLLEIVAHQQ